MFKYTVLKRLLDFIFSLFLLIFLFPLILLIGVSIKLTSNGKIFFVQKRIGQNKKIFLCFKFRTMVNDSKENLKKLLSKNISLKKEFTAKRKILNDPRITRIGKFLRYTDLDELPQILNVLLGDMSFIGPRPIREKK